MTGNIYPLIRKYLQNELTLDDLKAKSTTADWHLAKRQLTWLRRNPHIKWLDLDIARRYLSEQLAIE
ncbi:MAG TPA: tRNA (adenosine(37)-N6)-dimethylallyltransferase MiaA, partial [Candidatus Saccharimonadales bacterium]|nr:tRNA (adenosine(37)-N6)-dimethylallyltransferase MiaA [Candidatus Saccharimonadales bacterium]